MEGGGRTQEEPTRGKKSDLKKEEGGGSKGGRVARGRREELVWMSGMVARGMIRQSSLTRLGLMINTAVTGVVTTTVNNRKGESLFPPSLIHSYCGSCGSFGRIFVAIVIIIIR